MLLRSALLLLASICPFILTAADEGHNVPHRISNGYALPNGWRLTPIGKAVETNDYVLNVTAAPDSKALIGLHSGFNPHGLVVIDPSTSQVVQNIPLKSAWLGLAWSRDGKQLFVSGGNADGEKSTKAPIYVFDYLDGRLSKQPAFTLLDGETSADRIYWSGLLTHPSKPLLFAANRGTDKAPGWIGVFDLAARTLKSRIPVDVNPYDLVLSRDGRTLFVSNWGSQSVSVIDIASSKVTGTIEVGANPTDMELSQDGRLFVACSNDNSVFVIDTQKSAVIERIATTLYPHAPEGSTPDALALDPRTHTLFVANADNNDIAVIDVEEPRHSEVKGFIPGPWYPSALTVDLRHNLLVIGSSKGMGSYADPLGPHSPVPGADRGSVKSLQRGSLNMVSLEQIKKDLHGLTEQVYANTPYKDALLTEARKPTGPSVVPQQVGAGSPIKHILYIIKENRTYDQVFGDMVRGNSDDRLTLFGKKVTPNHHALANEYVLLDNLYCDGEVSVDGHSWSNSAYATDFNEKLWPVTYGKHSKATPSDAYIPSAGHLWDLCKRKGLTYRSYGEYASRVSDGESMQAAPGIGGLLGHVSPHYRLEGMRDTDNAKVFIEEFNQYEKNFDNPDISKRLPNFMVMSLPEDHTRGTRPGEFTPAAMVASNDEALGMIVDRVTHSRYWPQTAIFVIEDDAQDGADHVDARRTAGLVISPYIKREKVDSTMYTTSSFVRTMELLLGLPPMSQYDAAAMPLYATFGTAADLTPYVKRPAEISLITKNTAKSYGAAASLKMDFSDVDRAPAQKLNEVLWRSIKGADAKVPAPIHRFFR